MASSKIPHYRKIDLQTLFGFMLMVMLVQMSIGNLIWLIILG